jgi:hypothetical protein
MYTASDTWFDHSRIWRYACYVFASGFPFL